MDTILKKGSKSYHIDRFTPADLEPNKHFYVTIDQLDRKIYQFRLNNPNKIQRVERVFESVKDLRIPNPKKAESFYKEFVSDPQNRKKVEAAFYANPLASSIRADVDNYKTFLKHAPYFSKGESFGVGYKGSYNDKGVALWKEYQDFVLKKGYHGILDTFDRDPKNHFNVERPTIIFDAASTIKEVSRKNIDDTNFYKTLIPALRETPVTLGIPSVAVTAVIANKNRSDTKKIEAYRKKHPNSGKTDKEILKMRM